MRALAQAVAVVAALVLQTTLSGLLPETAMLDLVLVVVVYLALTSGPTTGIVVGSAAGLVQDALSSGVMGIGALAKTLVGFVVGRLGTQFIVTASLTRFVVFAAATVGHAAVFMGLYAGLGLRTFDDPVGGVVLQAVGNAVVGVIGCEVAERLPGVVSRPRTRGRGRR